MTLGIKHESYETSANRVILSHKYQKVAFIYRLLKSYHLGNSSVNGILSQNCIFPVKSTTHTLTSEHYWEHRVSKLQPIGFFFFF